MKRTSVNKMLGYAVASFLAVATASSACAQDRYVPYPRDPYMQRGPEIPRQRTSPFAPNWPMDEQVLGTICGAITNTDRLVTYECQPNAMQQIEAMGPQPVDPNGAVCNFNGVTRYNTYSPIVGRWNCYKNSTYVDPYSGYNNQNGPYPGSRWDAVPYDQNNGRDRNRGDRGRGGRSNNPGGYNPNR